MALKQLVNWLGQQRVDIPDLRAVESGVIFDFKSLIQCFVGNSPYILRGFSIPVTGVSGPATSLQLVVDSGVVWVPGDGNGSFLRVESGTSNEILSPSNAKVVGSFSPGANFISIRFHRATDPTTNDLVSVWDVDSQTEFTKTAPRGLVMNYEIVIDGSTFGNNAPVAIVNVSGSNVTSIKNCKSGLFRLGRGGANPNISYQTTIAVDPENNLLATTNSSPDPFTGGDWEFQTFKDWMDEVMTRFKEITGSTFWYGSNTVIPGVNLTDLFFDVAASKITGSGAWKHSDVTPGMLTWTSDLNIRSIFGKMTLIIPANNVTMSDLDVAYISYIRNQDFQPANTFTFLNGSTTVSATLNITGISAGDYVKYEAHNLTSWTKVLSVTGTTMTLTDAYPGANAVGKALRTAGSYTMQVASPNNVPVSSDTYWVAKRDDNAFATKTIAAPGSSGLLRSLDITTLKTTTAHGLVEGQSIAVTGASDSTFNGHFDVLTVVSPTEVTYLNPGNDVGSGIAGNGSLSSVPKIYLRLSGGVGELEQGEDVQIDDETTLNILKFIGAENEADTTPPYTIIPNGLSTHHFTSNNNLTQAISSITGNVNDIFTTLNQPAYEEPLVVVSGAPSNSNEVTGPILSGATLTIPLHSRNGEQVQNYVVGKGYLEVFLNGQRLTQNTYFGPFTIGNGWTEVGAPLANSNQIVINQDLVVDDILSFRIDGPGGPGAGSGAPDDDFHNLPTSVSTNPLNEVPIWDVGAGAYRKETRAAFLAGITGLKQINTYASNHTADASLDDVILINASGGSVNVALPAAATCLGKVFDIKKIDASGNTVVIDASGAETIDGSLTITLTAQYQSRTIVSDGTQWWII